VPTLSALLPILALGTASIGFLGVAWHRWGGDPLTGWGWRIALAMLAVLGGITLLMANRPHRGILPFGFLLAGLVLAILWELPESGRSLSAASSR
jgi:hypothetical protein